MAKSKVKNAVDTWVNNAAQAKNYNQKQKLWLKSSAKRGYIYFSKPWPNGVTIISARLKVYQVENWAGSVTLTVQRAVAKWSVNKINWTNQPGTTGSTATLTKGGGGSAGDEWDIDVTALVQAVANGSPWYGFRLTTNRATDGAIWSAQASQGAMRPILEVEWSEAPDEPENLKPGGGRAVSIGKPTFTFDYNDASGDDSLTSIQVQIATSEANANAGTSLIFDSGEVAASAPEHDGDLLPGSGISVGSTWWWRVRAKDDTGLWSAWADAVSFTRVAKGVLTITGDIGGGNIYEPSPTVSWTFTGVQRAFELALYKTSNLTTPIWTSGKITSTATSMAISEGKIVQTTGETYRVVLRVYDATSREGTPGDPAWVEAVVSGLVVNTDGGVTPPNTLAASSDPVKPVMHLTWQRAAAPDSFAIVRSPDGGTTWYYVDEVLAAEATTGGTGYAYDDITAAPYKDYSWSVLAVVAGRQSVGSNGVTGKIRRLAPFLMRKDQSDLVCFLNPERSRKRLDKQELHQPLSGAPVVVTQRLGGFGGTVSGRFVDDVLTGVTAKDMYDRFERMRLSAGEELILHTANETFKVVAYNMNTEVLPDASGITYAASFDWVQV